MASHDQLVAEQVARSLAFATGLPFSASEGAIGSDRWYVRLNASPERLATPVELLLARMATHAEIATAAQELIGHCSSGFFAQAQGFTCQEADAMARFLTVMGEDGDRFLEGHAAGDEEGDLHFNG